MRRRRTLSACFAVPERGPWGLAGAPGGLPPMPGCGGGGLPGYAATGQPGHWSPRRHSTQALFAEDSDAAPAHGQRSSAGNISTRISAPDRALVQRMPSPPPALLDEVRGILHGLTP